MKHRAKALVTGFLGVAVAAGVALWLHAPSQGVSPSIPAPRDLEGARVAPFVPAPRPAAIALPAPASSALAAPQQDPRAAPSTGSPAPGRADPSPPQDDRMAPGRRLHDEALAHPEDPNRWVDVGRYLFDHSQPAAGEAAFRQAWKVAATPEARDTVLDVWRRHGLPRKGLDPAAPASRSGGFGPPAK